ncbi:hypothetical protein M8C21_010157 [Ambrosia artemisiifolia]|uniref:Uncharacterized protein n=1 Tax=Ambrosia artemisiifolia TaxID=4212 RepID=A0AAD5GUE9_AMBAR|nr:hypothetical protein M8C21_010157 [Ambrosia artemisiifolia]
MDKGEKFGPYFVSPIPSSFYARLFPDESLHLLHSCYSIHWLSHAPKGVEDNKLNIYVSRTSPLNVMQAYENQFHTDFTKFLQLRSEEIVHGGCMVLTLRGRKAPGPKKIFSRSNHKVACLKTANEENLDDENLQTINDPKKEYGLVQESDINSFNLPFYFPHEDELRSIVQTEESFFLDHMASFEVNADQEATDYTDCMKNTSKSIRAITETLFTAHFGNSIIDVLFKKYEKNATEHPVAKESRNIKPIKGVTMTLVDILHMNSGSGDSSYANNSLFTKIVMQKATLCLKHTIKDMANQDGLFDHCFVITDLGCSSGMNTLLVASDIIDTVHEVCQERNRKAPQIQVCLNDLFGNDFNNVFKLLPNFYKTLRKDKGENFGPCFVSAVPGSFYERLFPDESLHLVHSSYSVHWLSQVPEGLENNRLNIYIAKTSPLDVLQAYGKQFHTDFTKFLRLRHEEMIRGGRMVLTLRSRSSLDPTSDDSSSFWEILTTSLLEMLKEGLVQESDINSFNIPFYFPHEDELRNIIEAEGSFSLDNMDVFELNWGEHDYTNMNENTHESIHSQGKNTANLIRSITESLFTSHFNFGAEIIDVLFEKCEKNAEEYLATKKSRHLSVLVSLTKK